MWDKAGLSKSLIVILYISFPNFTLRKKHFVSCKIIGIEKSHEGGRKIFFFFPHFFFPNVSAKDGVVKKNDIWV